MVSFKVHAELRKWLHNNVSAEVAGSVRIIYGGNLFASMKKILCRPHNMLSYLLR